jgi:hypothetical protein
MSTFAMIERVRYATTTRVRRALRLAFVACAMLVLSAHIGDTNTHYRGDAGPYTVQVIVRHPGVVPGLADITVRVEGDAAIDAVRVRPVQARLGLEGAPRPDLAKPVPGSPGLFAAQLWFMERGSYSVHVEVAGALGAGATLVPVVSLATETLAMPPVLGGVLIVLGLLLTAGFVTIIRAAVGESVLPPGASPDAAARRRGRIGGAGAVVVLVLALTGGWRWWGAEDAMYRNYMFTPIAIEAEAFSVADAMGLDIVLADDRWHAGNYSPLVPDHGKLMHAFLVREPELDAFAHVHPERISTDTFRITLPPLPPGTYRVYADIVHETGMAQTLTTTVPIPETVAGTRAVAPPADPDDSWWYGEAAERRTVVLADGASITWEAGEGIVADEPVELRFTVAGPHGEPAALEPYMGMLAHAAVRRDDGAVFVHLHPTGTISMAAQALLVERHLGGADGDDAHIMHGAHAASAAPAMESIVLPYAFPQPGRYRVWLQVKRGGQAQTAAFDVEVGENRRR